MLNIFRVTVQTNTNPSYGTTQLINAMRQGVMFHKIKNLHKLIKTIYFGLLVRALLRDVTDLCVKNSHMDFITAIKKRPGR